MIVVDRQRATVLVHPVADITGALLAGQHVRVLLGLQAVFPE